MCFFKWDESLDVNVEEMNNQHKKLIDLMETLYQKNAAGAARQELVDSADALVEFCIKHFRDEEEYMASAGYSGLESHKVLHRNLVADLTAFVDEFKNGDAEGFDETFITFLKTWLATHIRGIDTKYGYGL